MFKLVASLKKYMCKMLNLHNKFERIRQKKGDVIILDGGLATQLESVYNANIKHNRNKKVGIVLSENVLFSSLHRIRLSAVSYTHLTLPTNREV